MKNKIKIFSSFFLALIYCFAVNLAAKPYTSGVSFSKESAPHVSYISPLATSLLHHVSEVDASVLNVLNTLVEDEKNNLLPLTGYCRFQEEITTALNHQYQHFSVLILVNTRKTDLIFPFHYFW